MKVLWFVLMVFHVTGCVPDAVTGPPKDADCGAGALQDLIGQNISVLNGMKFAVPVRVLAPNSVITKDYAPGRLNISHDQGGTIGDLSCY